MTLLERFRPDLSLPASVTNMSQYAEIWVEQLLGPVSLEPFSPEEETAVATGHFTNFQKKGNSGRGAAAVRGRGRGARNTLIGERDLSNSLDMGTTTPRGATGKIIGNDVSNIGDGDEGDQEVLWSMPQGNVTLGTFDEMGQFTLTLPTNQTENIEIGRENMIPGHDRLPPPRSAASSLGSNFFDSLSSTPVTTPATSAPVQSSISRPPGFGDIALVHGETKWYYRDPSGQIQGPFSNRKMLHWYSRKYFPETLPLRREEDLLFEPLCTWKVKCGGNCPFELGCDDQIKLPSIVAPPLLQSTGTSSQTIASTMASPAQPQESQPTANILAKLGLPWTGPSKSAVASPPTPPIIPAAPTLPSQATSSSSAGGTLAEDQLRFLQQFSGRAQPKQPQPTSIRPQSISPSPSIKKISGSMAQLDLESNKNTTTTPVGTTPDAAAAAATLPNSGWERVDSKRKPLDVEQSLLKKSEQKTRPPTTASLAIQEVPTKAVLPVPQAKPIVSPIEFKPATSPTVGWAKPTTNSKPLCEIMQEEAQIEAARRAARSINNGPKSFAEMFRVVEPQPILGFTQATVISPGGGKSSLSVKSPSPVTSPKSISAISPISTKAAANKDTKSWCLAQLKPLESSYDINMCTILLMELKTPNEVASFVEDNMKSSKMDMKLFTSQLVERRFGFASAATIIPEPEPEFITVGRKTRKSTK